MLKVRMAESYTRRSICTRGGGVASCTKHDSIGGTWGIAGAPHAVYHAIWGFPLGTLVLAPLTAVQHKEYRRASSTSSHQRRAIIVAMADNTVPVFAMFLHWPLIHLLCAATSLPPPTRAAYTLTSTFQPASTSLGPAMVSQNFRGPAPESRRCSLRAGAFNSLPLPLPLRLPLPICGRRASLFSPGLATAAVRAVAVCR